MAADFAGATIEWGGNTITLLALMKQLMGITDSARDDELSMYLQMAGEAAESFIDNKTVSQSVTENFISDRSPIPLRFYPASSITEVLLDADDETDQWKLYASDGIYWATKGEKCGDPFKQLSVTYDAGFSPVPADLGYALVNIAIRYEESGGSGGNQVKKEVIQGVGSVEYVTAGDVDGNVGLLSPAVIGTLTRYRRFHV